MKMSRRNRARAEKAAERKAQGPVSKYANKRTPYAVSALTRRDVEDATNYDWRTAGFANKGEGQ